MLSTFQGRALGGKVICLLSPTLAPLLRCLEAIVELLLRSGVEPNPGPLTICTLCFNYKTKNKYNMTRHVKFTCLNRGQRKQTSGVRKSRRFLEDEVHSFISNIFNIAFDMQVSSPPKLGILSVKDGRRGSKTQRQKVLFFATSVDTFIYSGNFFLHLSYSAKKSQPRWPLYLYHLAYNKIYSND